MKIEFSGQDSANQWISHFASRFNRRVEGGRFDLPRSIGDGFIQQFEFEEGIAITYLYMNLKQALEIIRQPAEPRDLVPIFFYSLENSFSQTVDNGKRNIGYHTENGVYICSAEIGTEWRIPAKVCDYQVTISVKKGWLENTLKGTESVLTEFLEKPAGFYLFETLTTPMARIIKDVHNLISENKPYLEPAIHAKALELMILFLQRVENRPVMSSYIKLNQADVENIFRVRGIIVNNIPQKISVEELAKESGMSIRKLQMLFKQVFGCSITQYTIREKMNLAKMLLDSGTYDVSETGYYLGYSNLSHFTEAFRGCFGINPKKYIS